MSTREVDGARERADVLRRGFLEHRSLREQTRLSLPLHGVPDEFSSLRNGGYLSLRGPREARRWMLLLTVRDAMMQHAGLRIVAILPRDSDFRWLCDLHDHFSMRAPSEAGGPPPGWDSNWSLRVITAGATVQELTTALTVPIDLLVVDGVECLTSDVRGQLVGSPLFDDGGYLHDALIAFARRSDAAVVGGIDTTSAMLLSDRAGFDDGSMDLGVMPRSTNLAVTRIQRGAPTTHSMGQQRHVGWVAADD